MSGSHGQDTGAGSGKDWVQEADQQQELQGGGSMSLTTDPNDPGLERVLPSGQQEKYLVLSEEERQKGFVRPIRHAYQHVVCGETTNMGLALCETYARDPNFYNATFCAHCGSHYPLLLQGKRQFRWVEDGQGVGE